MDPLFSPKSNPVNANKAKDKEAPTATNTTSEPGLAAKSPMLSRLEAKMYPMAVMTNAHCPKGASILGERSKINPPMNPIITAPERSSNEISPMRVAMYNENPAIGKLIRAIALS